MGRKTGRSIFKLSATGVAKVKEPGYYGDGGGLWLQVSRTGTKSWVFRYARAGKAREMGLGPLHTVTLADARDKATQQRQHLLEGLDPIEVRNSRRLSTVAAAAKAITFDDAAEKYIEVHRAGWRNAKHADQWQNTLTTYASPVLGKLPVAAIETAHVRQALDPIWATKTETATRLRARIEAVIGWADKVEERDRLNPARWKGHLALLLAKPAKLIKTEHHAALPHARIGEFMKQLRAEKGTAARAVELIILTACRTSEAFSATLGEFDLDGKVWTIPADRTKSGRPHRVPLSRQAIKLLSGLAVEQGSVFVFPGGKEGRPLSNMAGLVLLRRMGLGEYTVHGFRSTFRDWAAEQTNYPRELAEAALAHVIKDKTEAAYARSDLLEKRARLMQAWADYCDRVATAAAVTPIRARNA